MCLVAQSCPTLCDPMDFSLPGSSVLGDPPGKDARVDCHALLQGIFATKKSNPGLPRCRRILYHLSHQGSLVCCSPWDYKKSDPTEWPNNNFCKIRPSRSPRVWFFCFYFVLFLISLCHISAWSVNIAPSQIFLSLCLSLVMCSCFIIFSVYVVILNVLLFSAWFPEGKKK